VTLVAVPEFESEAAKKDAAVSGSENVIAKLIGRELVNADWPGARINDVTVGAMLSCVYTIRLVHADVFPARSVTKPNKVVALFAVTDDVVMVLFPVTPVTAFDAVLLQALSL
jgi:hypothetical protein